MVYIPNTSESDAVLGPLTFTPWAVPSPTFTVAAHVLGPDEIRVTFTDPVDDTALNPAAYTIVALPGPPAYVPSIESVSFFDSERRSVVLKLAASLTYSAEYSLSADGVFSYYGDTCTTGCAFRASVPDPPRAVDAILAGDGYVDVVFDRPVGPYTSSATGVLAAFNLLPDATNSYHQAYLTSIPWTTAIPENNVRFMMSGVPTFYGPPMVSFIGVTDISGNSGGGLIPLSVANPPSIPYYFGTALQARQVIAFVDSLSNGPGGPGRAIVNVFFNRPMLASDVTNLVKWIVNQQGFHPVGDTVNGISATPYPALSDLVSFCNTYRTAYNAHASNLTLHPDLPVSLDQTAIIALSADLRSKFNAHVASFSASFFPHVAADLSNLVTDPAPESISDAIAVLNSLKSKFNSHRTSPGKHVLDDTDYVVLSADAKDITSAGILADELRSKILSHESSADYHTAADVANFPSSPYVLRTLLPLTVATLKDAVRFVEEAQSKFVAHGLSKSLHLYPDTIHTSNVSPSVPPGLNEAQAAMLALKTAYNAHLPEKFLVQPTAVRDRASTANSLPPSDALTYFAQLEIPADSSVPYYEISSNIMSEDLSSSTSFSDFIRANPGVAPLRLITSQAAPDRVILRFDKGVDYPDLTKLNITDSSGTKSPLSFVSVRPSLRSLFLFVTDLMEAYRYHNQPPNGAGHKIQDTVNFLLDSEFPGPSLSSIISALNRLRDIYNLHALSTTFHVGPDPNPVQTPYASDFESAIVLASILSEALSVHNVNTGIHLSAGADYASHQLYDTVEIGVEGFKEGETYTLDMDASGFFKDAGGESIRKDVRISHQFRGKSYLPYLAAVEPVPGVAYTSSGMRLIQDSMTSFFSRSMQISEVLPETISIDPPILTGRSSWTSAGTLSTAVSGMSGITYSIEASGLRDKFGNRVGRFIPPEFLIPVIPQTFSVGPYAIGPGCHPSEHYRDGRPALYFYIEAYEDHVVVLRAFSSLPPIEVYWYDLDLNLIGSASTSMPPELILNLLKGQYIVEVTVQNPMDTGTVSVDLLSRFDNLGPVAIESTYTSYFGIGTSSRHISGGYATYVNFVADAATTYVNVESLEGGYVSVWVMSGSIDGPVVGYGGGSSPEFQIVVPTVATNTYFVEVASGSSGPYKVTVRPSDFP